MAQLNDLLVLGLSNLQGSLTVGDVIYAKNGEKFIKGSFSSNVTPLTLTTNRTLSIPDASGVIATIPTSGTAVGSATKPIYFNGFGTAKASDATVGSSIKPIFLNAGTLTASTSTVGSGIKPIFLNAGTLTVSNSTVGSSIKPIFLNAGTLTASTSTVGSSIKPIFLNAGTFTASTSTVGGDVKPVHLSAGTIVQSTYTMAALDIPSQTFTGKNIFTASNNYNTTDLQKFLVGNDTSAFVFGGDGLQCYTGTNSTTPKAMYIQYYGGSLNIGSSENNVPTTFNGTVTATGNLTVGSSKIQTNGYIIGTWLQSTANNALSTVPPRICVQDASGWIYSRTPAQILSDIGTYNNFVTLATAQTISGNKTFSGQIILKENVNYGSTLPSTGVNGQVFFKPAAAAASKTDQLKINNPGTTSTTKYYILGDSNTASGSYSSIYRAYNTSGTANPTGVYFVPQSGVLYGAAWNDYAEFREVKEKIEAGRVVCETGRGDLILSTERLQPGAEIVSDTFGFAIGETKKCKTPIAVSGRVLAYPFEDREKFVAGDAVCAGPGGTVSKMTREEIINYPDRIIGIVSEIPEYEIWGYNNIKVNNRIWIRIK